MTTVIIARPAADGFEGRALPDAGAPEDRLLQLQAALRSTFDNDPAAMAEFFIDGDRNDGTPLVTEVDAHDTGAARLYLLESTGIATFKAERVDGRPVWTWTGNHRWTDASVPAAR